MDLSEKVFLVFGSSSDIGSTLIYILNNLKATVIGTYNKHKITGYEAYKCDLQKEEDIKKTLDKVINKHGHIDCIINAAAYIKDNDLLNKSRKEFLDVLNVNLVGPFLIFKYASLIMNKGIIINIASTDGIDTYNPLSMDYASSKAGLINLTKNMALALPNLKICAIAPNWVETKSVLEMDPEFLKQELKRVGQKRLLTKEEVALKILEIIIDDSILSGSIIRMDGCDE